MASPERTRMDDLARRGQPHSTHTRLCPSIVRSYAAPWARYSSVARPPPTRNFPRRDSMRAKCTCSRCSCLPLREGFAIGGSDLRKVDPILPRERFDADGVLLHMVAMAERANVPEIVTTCATGPDVRGFRWSATDDALLRTYKFTKSGIPSERKPTFSSPFHCVASPAQRNLRPQSCVRRKRAAHDL
jgi:hypothetical protein